MIQSNLIKEAHFLEEVPREFFTKSTLSLYHYSTTCGKTCSENKQLAYSYQIFTICIVISFTSSRSTTYIFLKSLIFNFNLRLNPSIYKSIFSFFFMLFIYLYVIYLSLCHLFIFMLFIYLYVIYLSLCYLFIFTSFIYLYVIYLSLCYLFICMSFIYLYVILSVCYSFSEWIKA